MPTGIHTSLGNAIWAYINSYGTNTVSLSCGHNNPAISAAQVVEDVARSDSPKAEHFIYDFLRRGIINGKIQLDPPAKTKTVLSQQPPRPYQHGDGGKHSW